VIEDQRKGIVSEGYLFLRMKMGLREGVCGVPNCMGVHLKNKRRPGNFMIGSNKYLRAIYLREKRSATQGVKQRKKKHKF
jgi:hypothetical protein